jgi:hypothetical protein
MTDQDRYEILKGIPPNILFTMTGKFGKEDALKAMHRAACSFLLALEDLGGDAEDDPAYYPVWGQACGLPGAKAFVVLRNSMEAAGWITRTTIATGPRVYITPIGRNKAVAFADALFRSKKDGDEDQAD